MMTREKGWEVPFAYCLLIGALGWLLRMGFGAFYRARYKGFILAHKIGVRPQGTHSDGLSRKIRESRDYLASLGT